MIRYDRTAGIGSDTFQGMIKMLTIAILTTLVAIAVVGAWANGALDARLAGYVVSSLVPFQLVPAFRQSLAGVFHDLADVRHERKPERPKELPFSYKVFLWVRGSSTGKPRQRLLASLVAWASLLLSTVYALGGLWLRFVAGM